MNLKVLLLQNFIAPVAFLFRIKMTLQLNPINDVTKANGKWVSTGIDPSFLVEGIFTGGWNRLIFDCETSVALPIKLYWDCGNGFSELESKVITTTPEGISSQDIIVFFPKNTIRLRLDPGEQMSEFNISNIKMRRVTRAGIALQLLGKLLKQRGYNWNNSISLLSKSFTLIRQHGLKGLWGKVKEFLDRNRFNGLDEYKIWVAENTLTAETINLIKEDISRFRYNPKISVLLPVYNVEEKWLRKCIESVINQLYENWELCIADDASPKQHIKRVLEEYRNRDNRVLIVYRENNGHISETTNSALELATGEYIALLDHDDELSIDALYENVKLLNNHPEADMIYSDEDKISIEGERHTPYFKPDWSPDLLLSQMYTCHFSLFRTKLAREIGAFRKGFEGSQDYDFVLRFTEKTQQIYHIPKVLYHWRTIPESTASTGAAKDYTTEAGLKALNEALQRRNLNAWVEREPNTPNLYLVHYNLIGTPKISIIIPTRDMATILDQCLTSIYNKSTYSNFEVIIVDNGSNEQSTFELFEKWRAREGNRFKVIRLDVPFNYSLLNNRAAEIADGELILLLNNDIEVISENWLEEMAGQAQREQIGAVGACLLYPDYTIQHGGVVLGIGGVAGHSHKYFDCNHPGYFSRLRMISNYSAVTAACLMIRKSVFNEVKGLEESLSVAFNDVDFCLKVREAGYYNIWLPHVKLLHHESKSRGLEDTPEKQARFKREILKMKERWGNQLEKDPYYNPNLTLTHEDFSIKR